MRVFAPTAFRYNGVDYPYGYQELPDALADTLVAAGRVNSTAPIPVPAAALSDPGLVKSFSDAMLGYRVLHDFAFGTAQKVAGVNQIKNVTDLAVYFDYWAYNLVSPTNTINSEVQRYIDFTHSNNFVFASDGLELTATLPNGTPPLLLTTTLSATSTASRAVTVADASSINVGQVLSFGPGAQYPNLCMTRSFTVRGTVAAGNVATMTLTPASDLGIADLTPRVFTAVASVSSTVSTLAQSIVDQVNADAVLASFGIYAFKDASPNGAYFVVFPKLANGPAPYGNSSTGSFTYFARSATAVGTGFFSESKQDLFVTWVVSKTGNVLTLNHPVTAASGATLYINPSRMMMRTDPYTASSVTMPITDIAGLYVGQAVSFGPQSTALGKITALDGVGLTLTLNSAVNVVDGAFVTTLPIFMASVTSNVTAGTTLLFSTAAFPAQIRVGQQVSINGSNPNNNIKVSSITPSGGTTTVVLDGVITCTTSQSLLFHEPIESAQIWSKFGVAPAVDGYKNIALELECDLPDASVLGSWPAFWLFKDPLNPTPVTDVSGLSEIDMLESFVYWGNATTASYRPNANTPVTYGYSGLTASPLPGNNSHGTRRKIQVVFTTSQVFYYLDGTLMFVKTFQLQRAFRAQVAANLAVGSISSSFNSNGFFPMDYSQFPMKFKLRRMRVLAS